jgi:predicted nucleotidyltransferase
MPVARLPVPHHQIADFCKRWRITQLALFGSVLRHDFRSDSDVDVLVSFAPDARVGLMDLATMEGELRGIFGREVDLVSRKSVEDSRNYIRRKSILGGAEVIYEAR